MGLIYSWYSVPNPLVDIDICPIHRSQKRRGTLSGYPNPTKNPPPAVSIRQGGSGKCNLGRLPPYSRQFPETRDASRMMTLVFGGGKTGFFILPENGDSLFVFFCEMQLALRSARLWCPTVRLARRLLSPPAPSGHEKSPPPCGRGLRGSSPGQSLARASNAPVFSDGSASRIVVSHDKSQPDSV